LRLRRAPRVPRVPDVRRRVRAANGDNAQQQDGVSVDRPARSGREERAPRGERNEGRRERRTEGAPSSTETPSTAEAQSLAAKAAEIGSVNEASNDDSAPRREGDERRGRSRDRYGRDRRERSPREEGEATPTLSALPPPPLGAYDGIEIDATLPPAPRTERSAVAPSRPIVVEAKPAGSRTLPKVRPFELPLDELAQVAEGSGLHWVNSDADRVAQVRAAIAAEPKPVHVPRERPPAIVTDEGPLVLVETRRDLGSMVLPFEEAGRPADARQ
jgi:ribonuclease E